MLKYLMFCALIALATSRTVNRKGNYIQKSRIVSNVLRNAPKNSNLIRFDYVTPTDISSMLISNYTKIRENIEPGFSCEGRVYGYYADISNDCQIFHVCVPLSQLYPKNFQENDILHFAFICPKFTVFTQDAMVCAWPRDAVPCELSEKLYDLNKNFGKKTEEEDEEKENEVAENERPDGATVLIEGF